MNYFGAELFDRLDAIIRNFLIENCLLDRNDCGMANDLTGNSDSGRILSNLYRNNFFILKQFNTESYYEYHQLFREFLIRMAKNSS